MRTRVLGLLVVVLVACGAGCSCAGRGNGAGAGGSAGVRGGAEGGGESRGGTSGDVCVPNETQLCHGPAACQGAQSCRQDGSGWEPCDCGVSADETGGAAGAPGTSVGGAGASTVETGAGGRAGNPGTSVAGSGRSATGGVPAGGNASGGALTGGDDGAAARVGTGGAFTGGDGGAGAVGTGGDGGAGAVGTGGSVSTTCGDNVLDPGEACDDGNSDWGDGCTPSCSVEPLCGGSGCTSTCGDGLVLGNEECDDGNRRDGDGCSSSCTVEPGYQCAPPPLGDHILVPIVYRDFLQSHPDFEPGATGCDEVSPQMVALELDSEGKPALGLGAEADGLCNLVTSEESFRQWYRDVPTVNATFVSTLTLYDNGAGGYVNRHGANGERYVQYTDPVDCWCGTVGEEDWDADGTRIPCTFCPVDYPETPECDFPQLTECSPGQACGNFVQCVVEGGAYHGIAVVDQFDGTPLFFPVDESTLTPRSEFTTASIAPPYGSWEYEPGAPLHNFSFTSEVRFWFEYREGAGQELSFTGDDDVWVFINRKLAVDLGGIHIPLSDSVNLDAMAASLGLVGGGLYEIVVFQAERQTEGSSYRLTLAGFNAAPSRCGPG
jgi:fibro-slime domain-containing protein